MWCISWFGRRPVAGLTVGIVAAGAGVVVAGAAERIDGMVLDLDDSANAVPPIS